MNRKLLLVIGAICLFSLGTFAQFTATGSVTDDQGEALIGATVLVKGTDEGAATDIDGKFRVQVPSNTGTLIISYTGHETQELEVTAATSVVNVALPSSQLQLSEVVVTGYGTQRREALTGSVTTLQSKSIEHVPFASVEQSLQGNVAGLQANIGNGQPGANVQIRIRGQRSISASSEPLYVVDGIPVSSGIITNRSETSNPLSTIYDFDEEDG